MTWPAPDPRKQKHPQWAECVRAWPMCVEGDYNPNCCRWPKSCRCDMGDPRPWHIRERLLWPAPDPDERYWPWRDHGSLRHCMSNDLPNWLTAITRIFGGGYAYRKVRKR